MSGSSIEAFWDASAIVPLCVKQSSSVSVEKLYGQYQQAVWWGTVVEVRSAFAREFRNNLITREMYRQAQSRLEALSQGWLEILPTSLLRDTAESLLDRFPLRAADSLQLAAAYEWSFQRPHNFPFIAGDKRLLDAARQLGFQAIEV